ALVGDLDVATEADRSMEGVKNSSSACGAVPVRCGPVPLTSALWPPRRPHVPPACQYRLALRVAFVPRAPVAMRDAYPWPQGTTGEDRVSRLKFSLSERLLQNFRYYSFSVHSTLLHATNLRRQGPQPS